MTRFPAIILFAFLWSACQQAADQNAEPEKEVAVTPVRVTHISTGILSDSLELTAVAAYLQNSFLKSTVAGYVRSVQVKPGDYVANGKALFTIQTKESAVIGKTIDDLDSGFHFSGLISIRAGGHGFVSQLNHQPGDYVQDGEQLAVISDRNSFVFLLNMPYEYREVVLNSRGIYLTLPDGTRLTGTLGTMFPTVDSVTQTQTVVIRVQSSRTIPQNLIARVHILRNEKAGAQMLPRAAVLSDEAQSAFWVMKMIDSNTAVRVPVIRGLELPDKIEIVSPVFTARDRIIVSGNYGLADSSKVHVE